MTPATTPDAHGFHRPAESAQTDALAPVPVSEAARFETLVAQHVERYQPPLGSLTHPETTSVDNPGTPDIRRLRQRRKWSFGLHMVTAMGTMLVGGLTTAGAGTELNAWLTTTTLPEWAKATILLPAMLAGATTTVLGCGVIIRHNDRCDERLTEQTSLTVPVDVGTAYSAYLETPQRLRESHADDHVVVEVESRLAYVDELLFEAARLHGLDASATEDGLAVRDQMVRMAAMAQSLVVLAERQRAVVEDVEMTTPLLLGRAPSEQGLVQAGQQIVDETEFVRSVLDG